MEHRSELLRGVRGLQRGKGNASVVSKGAKGAPSQNLMGFLMMSIAGIEGDAKSPQILSWGLLVTVISWEEGIDSFFLGFLGCLLAFGIYPTKN